MCVWQHSAVSCPPSPFKKDWYCFLNVVKKRYSKLFVFLWADSLFIILKLKFPTGKSSQPYITCKALLLFIFWQQTNVQIPSGEIYELLTYDYCWERTNELKSCTRQYSWYRNKSKEMVQYSVAKIKV